jgi:hypothetical protein
MSEAIKAWPNWQDGHPTVPGWYGVQRGTREREAYDIAQVFPDGAVRGSAGINWSICRFTQLPDFAALVAMVAERDTLRTEVDRLAIAVNEANERADRAERNAADPLPWGGQ